MGTTFISPAEYEAQVVEHRAKLAEYVATAYPPRVKQMGHLLDVIRTCGERSSIFKAWGRVPAEYKQERSSGCRLALTPFGLLSWLGPSWWHQVQDEARQAGWTTAPAAPYYFR